MRRGKVYRVRPRRWPRVLALVIVLGAVGIAGYLGYQQRFGSDIDSPFGWLRAVPLQIDFDSLDSAQTPDAVKATYRRLSFDCRFTGAAPYGEELCAAPVESINSAPARTATFFFREGHLAAMRAVLTAPGHPQLFADLQKRYGQYVTLQGTDERYGQNTVGWIRPHGVVAINDQVEARAEVVVLWVAGPLPVASPAAATGAPKGAVPERPVAAVPARTTGWVTYRSERYGFRLRYPRDSSAPARADEADAERVIIRRASGEVEEFAVHIRIYDREQGRQLAEPCDQLLDKPARSERDGVTLYRGVPRGAVVEASRVQRALCVAGPRADIYLSGEAQGAHRATLEAILNSFALAP